MLEGAGRVGRTYFLSILLALAVPVYVFLPLPGPQHQIFYDAIGACCLVVAALGVRRHRPQNARGWVLIILGYAGWVAGDAIFAVEQKLIPDVYPAPSDVPYLVSYLVLGAGMLMFVRSRQRDADVPALLDAAIITTGAATIVSVFFIAPLAGDSTLSLDSKLVNAAYPAGDLFLVGVMARMYATPGAQTVAYRLLGASVVATMITDLGYLSVTIMSGGAVMSHILDVGFLTGYVLVAAAASSPSMATLAETAPQQGEQVPTRRRLVFLAGGSMLPAVTLLLEGATDTDLQWEIIGVAMLILSLLVLVRMVGLLRRVEEQSGALAELARSDALTGAPNRRTWDHELTRACELSRADGSPMSVGLIDLDHFKRYNDTRGHQAGDRLLRDAVTAWSAALPAHAMLARYGGEEFAALFPGDTPARAAEWLRELLVVTPEGQTFSAGVALWDPGSEPGAAVAAADDALYAAKRSGRNRVVVRNQETEPMAEPTLPGFRLVTQPVVDLATLAVIGHEALTRFTDPDTAGIEEVFRRAHADGHGDLLELATVQAAIALPGRPRGHDLYVNVSARALISERFAVGLPERLDGVVFELNEDPGRTEPAAVAAAIARLRARGGRVALDDVGAGAEEFARLATLRPEVVKVDRSLVDGCATDPGRSAVLRALVTYAEHLGLAVCGEGVEEQADLDHLTTLGVQYAQGYLLARPAPGWTLTVAHLRPPAAVALS